MIDYSNTNPVIQELHEKRVVVVNPNGSSEPSSGGLQRDKRELDITKKKENSANASPEVKQILNVSKSDTRDTTLL